MSRFDETIMDCTTEGYRLTLAPCPALPALEAEWSELAERADCPAFLSWDWIGTLAALSPHPLTLARITRSDRLVALAILGGEAILSLNESGDADTDTVMIEYNGLLAERSQELSAGEILVAGLFDPDRRPICRELRLSGIPEFWGELCRRQGLAVRLKRHPQPAPFARLDEMRSDELPPWLSSNTRAQIRRSMRHFETLGPLALDKAEDSATALEWFSELEKLHTASWVARDKAGAFARGDFRAFHQRLITTGQTADLLRLSAGETVLGYLYNLRRGNLVEAYQSGFVYSDEPLWRPGLVAHVLAMRLYRTEGIALYRFLAGEARYKRSLSNGTDDLYWLSARRPTLLDRTLGLLAER